MAIEIEGALAFTEADLPTIEVRNGAWSNFAETSDGTWSWDILTETAEDALTTVKANLAYWLFLKRNPDVAKPVDPVAKADLLSVVEGAEWDDAEGLAELLAREGFRRG